MVPTRRRRRRKTADTKDSIQKHVTAEGIRSTPRSETSESRRTTAHPISSLKIAVELTIKVYKSMMVGNLNPPSQVNDLQQIMDRVGITKISTPAKTKGNPDECNGSLQKNTDPANGGMALKKTDVITNTVTTLDIDAADRQKTLTRQAGDTGEQPFTFHPNATSTGLSNLCSTPVHHSRNTAETGQREQGQNPRTKHPHTGGYVRYRR